MTKTKYYDLQMDDSQDNYDVEVVNANLKKIDEQMKTRENATDALQEPEFTVADKRENIASKEKISKILGKIAKFFTDLKKVAFTGDYADLTNKPTYGKGFITDKSGSITINLDGETITLDQAKNVIKLADTLKEKINGAFPAANLINNLTTTEAGFGLDARQGKALDDKITEINGSLISKLVLGQDNTLTSHQILENQTRLIQIVESNGNNALNKEVFGEHENFNNGFGCVFIFLKANAWRVSALAFPIAGWGLDILPVGQNSGALSLKWSKISLSNL